MQSEHPSPGIPSDSRYWHALSELARYPVPTPETSEAAFERINRITAQALGGQRAEIFHYTAEHRLESLTPRHREREEISTAGLAGIREVTVSSQAPGQSLLALPVSIHGRVALVLAIRREDKAGKWQTEEINFASAVAGTIRTAYLALQQELENRELKGSLLRFKSVAAASNDTIWDWDLVTGGFWWSDGFARLFGWSASDTESSISAWIRQVHPEDRDRVVAGIYAAIQGGASVWMDEYRFLSYDGKISFVKDRGEILRDSEGKGVRMVGGMTDVTSQKKAQSELASTHRALQMLSACNETLIRATDEKELLEEICRHGVEIGGYSLAWVGYARNDDFKSVEPMTFAGHEDGYLSEIRISWDENHISGHGPGARCIRSGKFVVCEDIHDPSSGFLWIEEAQRRGYRSVICLPLNLEGVTFGMLALNGSEAHPVGSEETKLLQALADDLASGIGNIRSRLQSQRTQDVVLKVAQAVSSGWGDEFFDLMTKNMVEALGSSGGLIGRLHPKDMTMTSLSYILDGLPQESITYDLQGTPCADVLETDVCVFPKNVQQLFPKDHFLVTHGVEAYAGIPLRQQGGAVAGIMAVLFREPVEDVTLVESTMRIFAARVAAELDRQEADARIRDQASLLDKAQDAILVRELDHTITYWNKSAERLYGWSAAEAIGKKIDDLLYDDPTAFYQATEKTLRNGEWIGEIIQIDRNGRELIVEGRWNLVWDKKGQPKSIFVINTDMTEHRRLEQQFIRAQRLESIGTMAGGLAHDLNNILTPISMAIELLKIRVHDERGQELLNTIAGSARRGAEMIEQVISFARGREGRRIEVNPCLLISEITKMGSDTFLKGIVLETHASSDLWSVWGDPTQLHQVLLNLCLNARDAIADHGRITIDATNVHIDDSFAAMTLEAQPGPHICITVEDNGTGIEQEHLEKIFDPFFTTKAVGKGTGLGLSTSLAIVKSHGGFIRVRSKPGQGTRFSVYLPARPAASATQPKIENAELPQGNSEMVLIIDDEESIRQITRQTLEAYGYRTMLAENGDEAVSLYAQFKNDIHVVITDMMMPVMDGADTISLLMKINPQVKIIAVSGIAANGDLATSAGTGVKRFLAKPFRAETLLNVLTEVLKSGI